MSGPFDYKGEFDKIMLLVQAASNMEIDLERIEKTLNDADTIGPFIDPTRYRDALYSGRLDDQRQVVDFAAPFIRKSRELLERIG